MRNEIDLKNLKEIYLISNTASFLYNSFVNDEGVQFLASKHTTKELIESFVIVSKTEINDITELVWAYTLYVAILVKSDNDTFEFLEKDGAISFEWFVELKNIFLSRLRPENYFSFSQDIKTIPSNKVKEYSESATQVFELS